MPEVLQELEFPVAGLDVGCEADRQTPRTTPVGVNVRGCDPRTLRVRGAARPGLTRLVPATVSGAAGFPVQHLNVIVDPTVAALLAQFEPGIDWIPDPSTNNAAGGNTDPTNPLVRNPSRVVPPGGSGVQPNRHVAPRDPTTSLRFVQLIDALGFPFDPGTVQFSLTDPPNAGDLIIVVAQTLWEDTPPAPAAARITGVTNDVGDAYTQVGGGGYFAETNIPFGPTAEYALSYSMWFLVATGGASDQVIKATPAGNTQPTFAALVYRGLATLGPLYDQRKAVDNTPGVALTFSGLLLNGTTQEMVVAVFAAFGGAGASVTPVASLSGYTVRYPLQLWNAGPVKLCVVDTLVANGVGPEARTLTLTPPEDPSGFMSIAASFHR